jgi:DNA replication licensing factor MCM7
MEEGDRTAIHEVMEQQTVSIAKAGITTTLNARAAVLAAANPVWGRWRPKASPEANLGLPASLLSRFDLTWIILDKADQDKDAALAQHVTHVHIHNAHPPLSNSAEPFSAEFLRAYIARAREKKPYVPKELTDYIVQNYVTLRKDGETETENSFGFANNRQRFCTARMLLSILRLSQAHARLFLRDAVERADVDEAMRLVNTSKDSHLDESDTIVRKEDPISAIWGIIQSLMPTNRKDRQVISHKDALQRVTLKGFSQAQFEQTLHDYREFGLITYSDAQIRMVVPTDAMEE